MTTRTLTANVPSDLAEQVDRIAERRACSQERVIEQALAAWVADDNARYRLTQEALADVDAGRVSDHARVQDWGAQLGTDSETSPAR